MKRFPVTVLVGGEPSQTGAAGVGGEVLFLDRPLSLWGGVDPVDGRVIDRRHPAAGRCVTGRVLVLPAGRGSSSASSILLELVRLGTAPALIVTARTDGILALGAVVSAELYGRTPPVLVAGAAAFEALAGAAEARLEDGDLLVLEG